MSGADPENPVRARWQWWLLGPIAAPLLLFYDGILGRRLLAPGEAYTYYLPMHTLMGRLWRAGELPGWNTWSFSGSPLVALGQAGAFYPPNVAFVLLSPVIANNVTVAFTFSLAGAGGYLLVKHLTGDAAGGAAAGLCFALSGFFFAHIAHQAITDSAAWMPWILYGFERLRQRITLWRVAVGGGSIALAMLAGHFQMVGIAMAVLLGYGALVLAFDRGDGRDDRKRTALGLGLMVAVGFGLSAVQWMTTAAVLGSTQRAKLPFAVATSYSLRPSHLPLLGFPFLFGGSSFMAPYTSPYRGLWNLTELSGYVGMAAFVLASIGATVFRRDRRIGAFGTLAFVALLASMGGSTPLGRVIYHLPLYGQFRSWARFVVVVDLVVAILAGYGVAALRRSPFQVPWAAAVVPAALVVAGALVVTRLPHVKSYVAAGGPAWQALVLPAGAAVLAFGLVALARKQPGVAAVACCVLLALDAVGSFGISSGWRSAVVVPIDAASEAMDRGAPPNWGPITDRPGGLDRFVLASPEIKSVGDFPQINAAAQVRSANGFDPLAPQGYTEGTGDQQYFGGILQPEAFWRNGSDLLDLLRITTVVTQADSTDQPPVSALGPPTKVAGGLLLRYEHSPTLPDAWVVGATRRASRAQILDAIAGKSAFDPSTAALLESSCARCPSPAEPGLAGTATRRSGDSSIAVSVNAARPGLLVVSEASFPGWHVTVDGHSAAAVQADGLLLAVPVPKGHSEVHFHYRPPGMRLGGVVSMLSAGGLLAWLIVDLRRRRRIHTTRQRSLATEPGPETHSDAAAVMEPTLTPGLPDLDQT